MQTALLGGSTDALSNAATEYAMLSGPKVWGGLNYQPIPTGGTLRKLKVSLSAAPTDNAYIFTVMVNGNPSALTCTVAVGGTTAEDDHIVAVAAGDNVCLRSSYAAAPGNTPSASWSTIFTGTIATEGIILGAGYCGASLTTPAYSGLNGWVGTLLTVDAHGVRSRIPTGGILKKFYCCCGTNDADTATLTLLLNGAPQALACSITSLVCTPDVADHVDVVDNDYVAIYYTGDNSNIGYFGFGLVFEPTTAGEFLVLHNTVGTLGANLYHGVGAGTTNWSNDDGVRAGNNAFLAKRIRVALDAAPGAGCSRAFYLRKAGVGDTALTVTLGAADTNVAASIDASIADWVPVNLKQVRTGVAAEADTQVGIVGYMAETAARPKGSTASKLIVAGAI